MNAYRLKIITTFLVILITANAMAQDKIIRKELLTANVGTRQVKAGEVIYEPANTPIAHYDNASQTEPLKFICYYLINKETVLIKMLPNGK